MALGIQTAAQPTMIRRAPTARPPAVAPGQMLAAIHKADPATLNRRYTGAQLQQAYIGLKKPAAVTAPTEPVAATPAPAVTPTADTSTPAAPVDNSAALYPSIRAFEPANYQGSPLYQFQLEQGAKQLSKLYNARGQKGSGAEIAGNTRFVNELGAQEAQRAQGVAEQEANRLERVQQNESSRLTGQSNDQWSRIMDVLNLMLAQNPQQGNLDMTGKLGSLVSGQGTIEGNNIRNQMPTVRGGAGGPPPRYTPPTPSGPNMGNTNVTGAIVNGQNNVDYGKILTNLLGSVF